MKNRLAVSVKELLDTSNMWIRDAEWCRRMGYAVKARQSARRHVAWREAARRDAKAAKP